VSIQTTLLNIFKSESIAHFEKKKKEVYNLSKYRTHRLTLFASLIIIICHSEKVIAMVGNL
jgi:hypothetical protein